MSKIREWTAKAHVGLLELTTLILLSVVALISMYEGFFLTKVTFMVYGQPPEAFDYVANFAPLIVGTFLTMGIPVFLHHSKSKMSSGGIEISPLEIAVLVLMILGALFIYTSVYFKTMEALYNCKQLGKLTKEAYDLRTSTFTTTVSVNVFIDFLLGLWSIYEVNVHNGSLKTLKTGRYRSGGSKGKKSKSGSASSTPTVAVKIQTEIDEENRLKQEGKDKQEKERKEKEEQDKKDEEQKKKDREDADKLLAKLKQTTINLPEKI